MTCVAAADRAAARTAREALRVLGVIGEPMNGVSYVRFVQPFHYLRDDGFELRTLGRSLALTRGPQGWLPDPGLLDGVALLIFPQMVAAPVLADGSRVQMVGPLCDEARRRGVGIVYSADDYLPGIERQNPGYETIEGAADNLKLLLDRADALIVATAQLRDSFSVLDKPIHLLPNSVEPSRWPLRPGSSGELRVGWSGSSSHLDDLLMVLPAIARLKRRVECRFVVQGLADMPLDDQLEQIRRGWAGFTPVQRERAERVRELAGQLRALSHRHVPFQPMEAFFALLPALDLDIGICPLLDTPFNRHRSPNKFYEYAATGSLTVASRVGPYPDEVSVTVPNDVESWAETLERYLREPEERKRELAGQRAFVLAERNIEKVKDRWAAALREILQGAGGGSRGTPVH